jgi:hypothetical protein
MGEMRRDHAALRRLFVGFGDASVSESEGADATMALGVVAW